MTDFREQPSENTESEVISPPERVHEEPKPPSESGKDAHVSSPEEAEQAAKRLAETREGLTPENQKWIQRKNDLLENLGKRIHIEGVDKVTAKTASNALTIASQEINGGSIFKRILNNLKAQIATKPGELIEKNIINFQLPAHLAFITVENGNPQAEDSNIIVWETELLSPHEGSPRKLSLEYDTSKQSIKISAKKINTSGEARLYEVISPVPTENQELDKSKITGQEWLKSPRNDSTYHEEVYSPFKEGSGNHRSWEAEFKWRLVFNRAMGDVAEVLKIQNKARPQASQPATA